MARQIADTPILRGKDAVRFIKAMENVQPVSKERRERMKRSYQWFKEHADPSLLPLL